MADQPKTDAYEDPALPKLPPVENQKSFGLTQGETQMLVMVRDNQNAIFSVLLSHIAGQRLAYKVGPNTQFILNPDLSEMKVGELKIEEGADLAGSAVKTSESIQTARGTNE